MTISLSALARSGAVEKEVALGGGRKVTVRALVARDEKAVMMLRVRPTPPKKPPGGSLSEPVADEADGAYRQQMAAWSYWIQVVTVAVAIAYRTADGAAWNGNEPFGEANKQWASRAFEELTGALRDGEIAAMYGAVCALDVEGLLGKADSGSSGPPGMSAPMTPSHSPSPSGTGSAANTSPSASASGSA